MPVTVNKRILLLFAVLIGASAFAGSMVIQMYHPLPEEFFLELKLKVIDKPNLQIMFDTVNVTTIDCSSTSDNFDADRRLPNAIWSTVPSMFYNSKSSLVVYSNNDNISRLFCLDLLRHVHVDVYIFKGGYEEWMKET